MAETFEKPNQLVLDAAYTLEMIRERELDEYVTCRDLDGFFGHVWSVHPFATLLPSKAPVAIYGRPETYEVSERHTVIEGKAGRFRGLRHLFALNFALSQVGLFVSLRRLIRRNNIRVIRAVDPLYLGLFAWALARLSRLPLLVFINGNNEKVRQNTGQPIYPRLLRSAKIERYVESFVLRRADLVAALNRDNADFAIRAGADPDRTVLFPVGNLLAPEHFVAPEQRGRDDALFARLGVEPGRYLLCVGRLEAVKRPQDTVQVLAHAVRAGHDLKLFLAGDGRMRDELQALANEMGVGDRLIIGGNLGQPSLAQLNAHAACVISPLTGRALAESALAAAPVAAYDVDWQGDIIATGETGELVPFQDVEALAAATVRLLDDPEAATRMGRTLRERALAMFDLDRLIQRERSEYVKLFAKYGFTLESIAGFL